jgi:hypothetical protein
VFEKFCSNRLYIVLGPLALTAPLTSFLRFYDISFLSSEAFYSFAVLALIGFVAGLIMALGGNLAQALISSVIIVLLMFSETNRAILYPEGIRFRYILLLSIFLVGTLLYFLRENRIRFLLIVFGVMWLLGTVSPSSDKVQILEAGQGVGKTPQPETSLPPYVHIIVDEHIGIEGIPSSYDENNKFSLELKNKYIDQGFFVFGRAYSRFRSTIRSFSSFLNFQSQHDSHENVLEEEKGVSFKPNALFETLTKRGYIINTYTTEDIFLCNNGKTYRLGKCVTVLGGGLKHHHGGTIILHNFVKKLHLFRLYAAIASKLGMPEVNTIAYPGTPKAVVSANKFIDFLGEGKRGNAYFIHLRLPHSPYLFDEKCSYKFDGNFFEKEKMDVIYGRYIKQIQCTHLIVDKIINKLDSNQESKDSTIVIHSDHGSRIYEKPDETTLFTSEEYIQGFSTFFVIRSPTLTPGYDRRPFALDELLKVSTLSKPDFMALDNKKEKFVYTIPHGTASKRFDMFEKFTLPPFANGSRAQTW